MKISRTLFRPTSLVMGIALAAGCTSAADETEDPDFIEETVEDEFGGFSMTDEDPMFGEAAVYADLDLADEDAAITDDYAADAEVLAVTGAADAVLDVVTIVWGGGDQVTDWSGEIEVSSGVMVATRAIRFEGNDGIEARDDKRVVRFNSRTLRYRDGLRLLLAARADDAAGRTLTYRINGNEHTVEVDRLLDDAQVRDVGDNGDRIAAVAHRRPVDLCDSGFLRGHWLQMGRGYGVLRGRVANSDGDGLGHIKGIYGTRRSGERIFFGKYINRAGQFKGIFRGTYRNGHFAGRWLVRSGDHGVLGGIYRETLPGRRNGGGFIGRWAETSCNSRISDRVPDDR